MSKKWKLPKFQSPEHILSNISKINEDTIFAYFDEISVF